MANLGSANRRELPPDHLDQIATPTEEDKEVACKGVLLQHRLGLRRQGAKPSRMSVTPAASQTRVLAGTGITPSGPDQPRQRIRIVAAADPHPVPARKLDLDVALGGRHGRGCPCLRDNLHGQKARLL